MTQLSTGTEPGHEFAGTMTRYLVQFLRNHVGPESLDEVLRMAGDTRDIEAMTDSVTWSSYREFRRLLEAAGTVLGSTDRLALAAATGAWDAWSQPEVTGLLHVLGSPAALYADIGLSAASLTTAVAVEAEQAGPDEWVISYRFADGYEPFTEFCAFASGLFSVTPKIFGFPAATMVEEACQCDGASSCRVRLRWEATDEQRDRTQYLEGRAELLDARLEVLQRTLFDLVSSESIEGVLASIVASAAQAVMAPWFVLAINAIPSASEQVYSEGIERDHAADIATKLLAGGTSDRSRLVVDVASRRRNYGRLAAIRPGNETFYPQELRILEAYGRVAAAALDSATAVEEAREKATTAEVLMELSRSLGEIVSTDEMALRVTRAVPALLDCDRAALVLFDAQSATARIAGTFGHSPDMEAALPTSALPPAPGDATTRSPDPEHGVDRTSEFNHFLAGEGSAGSITVPITTNGQLLGWVNAAVIDRPERLAPYEVGKRLRGLASQAAAAISNGSLLDRIRHQALHDGLTGLPNRALILDRVDQMLTRSRRQRTPTAALFIDLDDFRDINETLGHGIGDQLLRAVAVRLATTLRESDSIGRLGGDEFVVLVEGIASEAGPELVAERLLEVLREPFALEGRPGAPLAITASIGIAMGECPSAGELLRDADVALYAAKAAGKNRYVLFRPEMQTAVLDRLELETDLRGALSARQFFLVYQPILNLATREVTGVEALLRWRHPTRGVVQPDNFIPLLEETGMIVDIGRWVLQDTCRQAAIWHADGRHLDIAVNVSARQLEDDLFVGDVEGALLSSGLDPAALVIEITETTIMRDAQATAGRLRSIKSLGVRVSIDDFGTGYSSLAYLRQFPVDSLKIDRSFISGYANSPEAEALIRSLVQLGKSMGLETIAEGIEEEDQFLRLQAQNCDSGQGYLFARPLEVDALDAFLTSQTSPPAPPVRVVPAPPAAALTGPADAAANTTMESLLSAHPQAPVCAVTVSNFLVEIPTSVELTEHKRIVARNMMDVVVPADQKAVVDAFHEATLCGSSVVAVHLAREPDRTAILHYLDVRPSHGVFIAVLTGDLGTDDGALHNVVDAAPVVPRFCQTRKDNQSVLITIDDATTQILGWTREQMVGHRSLDFIHPDDQQLSINTWMEMADKPGAQSRAKLRHLCSDGSWRWMEITNQNMMADPIDPCVVADMADISDEMAALEAVRSREELLDRLAEALPLGLFQVDADRRIIYTNDRLHQIVATERAASIDEQLEHVIAEDRVTLHHALDLLFADGRDCDIEVRLQLEQLAELRLCTMSLRALTNDSGEISGAIVCVADVTDSARMRTELEQRATLDLLTHCHNRGAIMSALEASLAQHGETAAGTAVIFVDLDQFKPVNDELGHAAGDELLTVIADRLRDTVRGGDLVGRLGGDEFLVVCPGVNAPHETMRLGQRIAEALGRDITIGSATLSLRASIGVAWTKALSTDADALVGKADTAMYESKRQRAGLPVLFKPVPRRSSRHAGVVGSLVEAASVNEAG